MNFNDNLNPEDAIHVVEFKENFNKFCSLCCIIYNKKLNYPNIFLLIIKDPKISKLYKLMCNVVNDYEGIRLFLEIEPSIHKSKYVKKYLNHL